VRAPTGSGKAIQTHGRTLRVRVKAGTIRKEGRGLYG
jgi:hypothetical protein